MSKVCVFFAPGYEEIEALTVVDLLRRAGISTEMVSVSEAKMVAGSHGINVEMDLCLSEVDFASADMLVLPGGMPGTKNLEACPELMTWVDKFYNEGKYLGAICAAPSILGHRGILQGKKACAFPGFESQLTGAEVSLNSVERDDKVITSRGMGCAIDFALEIATVFKGKAVADELAEKIIYSK